MESGEQGPVSPLRVYTILAGEQGESALPVPSPILIYLLPGRAFPKEQISHTSKSSSYVPSGDEFIVSPLLLSLHGR